MRSQWKITGNDTVSQISLEFLKREILELVDIYNIEKESNKINKSDIIIAEKELINISNLLIRIANKTENERKKYANYYPDKIESILKRICRSLNLTY
jgi:hypothetical protein